MVKKVLTITTLSSLGVCVLMLIVNMVLAFAKVDIPSAEWKVVGTFAAIFALSLLTLNFNKQLAKRSIPAIIAVALLAVSTIILLILIWDSKLIDTEVKERLCWTIFITTMLYNLTLNPIIKLHKKLLAMQIIMFVLLAICYVQFMIAVFDPESKLFNNSISIITLAIPLVVIVALEIVASIFKVKDEEPQAVTTNEEMITISKVEYESLQNRIKELEEKLNHKEDE